MTNIELWKPIPDFEGYYEISNMGRVKSLARLSPLKKYIPETIMKAKVCPSGYHQIALSKQGKPSYFYIHRLVAFAFVEGHFEGAQVNHKDEIRANNQFYNLEWCTGKYNCNYKNRMKKIADKLSIPVIGTNLFTGEKLYFDSVKQASRNGFSEKGILHCLSRKFKTSHGYSWKINSEKLEQLEGIE